MSKKRIRTVRVGNIELGGKNPVAVQSMTKTKTRDVARTMRQIRRLERSGCEIVRCAVVDTRDAAALKFIKAKACIPVVADIHFDYRLAMRALDCGVDKIRINPGNIGEAWKVSEIIKKAREKKCAIRVGVNSGSLPKTKTVRYKRPSARAILDTVEDALEIFDKHGFHDVVVSAKGADVMDTIAVYRSLHHRIPYPLHIGITEAGLPFRGGIKSAVGLGVLLDQGIGDTIRVSLTGDPVLEVIAAYEILGALKLRVQKPVLISCPTCGRCEVDLIRIAKKVEQRLARYTAPMKVAVMGCVVNGPGEARDADYGIACGKGRGIVFMKGKEVKRVKESYLVETLFEVLDENTIDR
jgi:(E)-4-hydroxy-3-methylbut-2-enyl-diphosphate synthase